MLFLTLLLSLSTIVASRAHDEAHKHLLQRGKTPVTQCNSDNCYRYLLHTPTAAASLCTYTGTVTTTVTPYTTFTAAASPPAEANAKREPGVVQLPPVALPASCAVGAGTALTSRVSSACSCLHSESTTTTSTIYAPTATTTTLPAPTCVNSRLVIDYVYFDIACNVVPVFDPQITKQLVIQTLLSVSKADCYQACVNLLQCSGLTYQASSASTGTCQILNEGNAMSLRPAVGTLFASVSRQMKV